MRLIGSLGNVVGGHDGGDGAAGVGGHYCRVFSLSFSLVAWRFVGDRGARGECGVYNRVVGQDNCGNTRCAHLFLYVFVADYSSTLSYDLMA